jgi:cytochrome c oxidase subunit 3
MSSRNPNSHEYHLVEPSPWPLLASIGALILCIGAVIYFRTDDLWLMLIGLAIVIYVTYMWFRDIIIEGEHQGHHTPVVQIGLRYGMTLFIASEVMFFVAWFWAYFNASLFPTEQIGSVWPPAEIHLMDPWHIPLINTLILLLSGTTVTWAHHALT